MLKHFKKNKKSFTLLELLIVIAIIGILTTLSLVALNVVRQKARDVSRVNSLKTLANALEMYYNDYGHYPESTIVVGSDTIYSRDGFCLEKSTDFATALADYLNRIPKDPLYKEVDYPEYCFWYRTRRNGQEYKIFARMETSNYDPALKDGGVENNSYEVFSGDAYNLSRGYILVSKNSNNSFYFERTGSNLKDKTGFYVMQYEAKYDKSGDDIGDDATTYSCIADSGDGWDWRDSGCSSGGRVVSTPEGSPIVHITHNQALTVCPPGFHLITNDEWMAIARDAEKVAANWSGGSVGSGCLYRGNNGANDSCGYNGSDPEKGYNRNSKAKLTLSNNSEIWDLAGNVWEHVKNCGATAGCTNDTLISLQDNPEARDSTTDPLTDSGFNWSDFAQGGGLSRWLSLTQPSYYGDLDNDGDSDNDDKNYYRPSNDSYSALQGLGRIYHYSNSLDATDNRVFLRGGSWAHGSHAGAFALHFYWTVSIQNYDVGLRCAR